MNTGEMSCNYAQTTDLHGRSQTLCHFLSRHGAQIRGLLLFPVIKILYQTKERFCKPEACECGRFEQVHGLGFVLVRPT